MRSCLKFEATVACLICVMVLAPTGVLASSIVTVSSARSDSADVIVIEDVSFNSDCFITSRELDPLGQVVLSESTEACPAGTVLHTFPTTEEVALAGGLDYMHISGDPVTDQAARDELIAAQLPVAASAEQALTCAYRRYQRSYSYAINSRNYARVSGIVDFAQTEDCYGRIYTIKDSFSGSPAVYWSQHRYQYPISPPFSFSAGCRSLGTATNSFNASDGSYGWKISLGGYYYDKVEDLGGCSNWGNSYTGSVLL